MKIIRNISMIAGLAIVLFFGIGAYHLSRECPLLALVIHKVVDVL
jgi:hypothetical protein